MLIIPINNFDRQQLSKVFNNKKIDTADWIQVIRQIITNDKNEFDLQYLQQKLIEVNDKIDITLILDALDKILFNIRQKKSKNILNR